jgi:hypothetical protein
MWAMLRLARSMKVWRALETGGPLFLPFGLARYCLKVFKGLLGLSLFGPKHDRPNPTLFPTLV